MNVVNVTKYSGELEVFDLNKLIGSLQRSQATVKKILEDSEELCTTIEVKKLKISK